MTKFKLSQGDHIRVVVGPDVVCVRLAPGEEAASVVLEMTPGAFARKYEANHATALEAVEMMITGMDGVGAAGAERVMKYLESAHRLALEAGATQKAVAIEALIEGLR